MLVRLTWEANHHRRTEHHAALFELFADLADVFAGVRAVHVVEDVLGNVRVRCQYAFCLRRVAAPDIENAQWLLSLQQWVQQQAIRGLAPVFGDEPHEERIRAFDGKLQQRAQVGSEHYTVMLTVEFTKIFRGERYGKNRT